MPRSGHGGAGYRAGHPSGGRAREKVQRILCFNARLLRASLVRSAGLIDSDEVRHFHDASLHTLQLVSGAGQHEPAERNPPWNVRRFRTDNSLSLLYFVQTPDDGSASASSVLAVDVEDLKSCCMKLFYKDG
jgi:hypothetical protein